MDTFIYIKRFIFNDPGEEDRFYGHPVEGKVYKAYKQGEFYRVPLESKDGAIGIILKGLDYEEGEGSEKWNYNISEIDERNIGDFDISIDDLEIIAKEWNEEPVEDDIKEIVKNVEDLSEMIDESMDIPILFDKISDYLNVIFDNDRGMFNVLMDVMKTLSEELESNTETKLIKSIIQDIKTLKKEK